MSKNGMDNAKKNLYTNSRKKIFHDWQTTYHVTQQQFMFVKAKINERKTNKKIEHDELLRTVYLYKIIFRKLNKKKASLVLTVTVIQWL